MIGFVSFLTAALATSSSVLASPIVERASSVTCHIYQPVNWKSTKGRINFYDNNPTDVPYNGPGFHAPTLPANATITPSGYLYLANKNTSVGYPFSFQSCGVSSPTFNLTTNFTQSSCSHGGCYINHYNFVRVINPVTGHCLTTKSYGADVSTFNFQACETNPTDRRQFWETSQYVNYSPGYGAVTSVGGVDFENVQYGDDGTEFQNGKRAGGYFAWSLSRSDNRTVEVVTADYTQVGLSASLVEA